MSKIILTETVSPPSTPASSKMAMTVTATKRLRLTDDQGVSSEFGPTVPVIYGQNYIGDSIEGEDTNSTETYKTYLGLAYPAGLAIAGRKYEIDFCSTFRFSTTGRNTMHRIAIDGTTVGVELEWEPKDTGSDIREPVNYKHIVDGSALNNAGGFIDYDFKTERSGNTVRVYSATLTFKRVL